MTVMKVGAGLKFYSAIDSTIHWMTLASKATCLSLSVPLCKMDIIIKLSSRSCGKVTKAVSTKCMARVHSQGRLATCLVWNRILTYQRNPGDKIEQNRNTSRSFHCPSFWGLPHQNGSEREGGESPKRQGKLEHAETKVPCSRSLHRQCLTVYSLQPEPGVPCAFFIKNCNTVQLKLQ